MHVMFIGVPVLDAPVPHCILAFLYKMRLVLIE